MGHVRSVGRCSLTTAPADTEVVKNYKHPSLPPFLNNYFSIILTLGAISGHATIISPFRLLNIAGLINLSLMYKNINCYTKT